MLAGLRQLSGNIWPRDPFKRVRLDKWCRTVLKLAPEKCQYYFADVGGFWGPASWVGIPFEIVDVGLKKGLNKGLG